MFTSEPCPAALMSDSEFVTVRTIPGSPTIKKNLAWLGFSFVRRAGKQLCPSIVLKLLHE